MMQGRFGVLSSKYTIYCILSFTNMQYIVLDSQRKSLYYYINQIHEVTGLISLGKAGKQIFNLHSLN